MRRGWLIWFFGTFAILTSNARAENSNSFAGETINILVPSSPGGGFDAYTRIITKYMPKYIPGKPTMVFQYMPGGGGLKAANYLYNVAPRNGLTFGMLQETIANFQLLKKGAKYDVSKFSYIGRLSSGNHVIIVSKQASVASLRDAMSKEVVIGATGIASWTYTTAVIVKELAGAKFRIVLGYPNTAVIDLAMQKGELAGRVVNWGTYAANHQREFATRELIPIVEVGVVRSPGMLPGVPLLSDLAKSDDDRQVIEFLTADTAIGRAYAAPQGVPADRLSALRKAFADTMKDRDYLKDAATRGMTTDGATGDEIQRAAAKVVATPKPVIARAKALLGW